MKIQMTNVLDLITFLNICNNDPEKLPSGKSVGDPLDLYDRDEEAGFEFIDYFIQQNPGVLKFNDPTVEATDRQQLQKHYGIFDLQKPI